MEAPVRSPASEYSAVGQLGILCALCIIVGCTIVSTPAHLFALSVVGEFLFGIHLDSGQFAFEVGLPAKSGVSGCVLVVLPREKLGFCIYSPRLDAQGNSVRGLHACKIISNFFSAHIFDNLTKEPEDEFEGLGNLPQEVLVARMLSAASTGDLEAVKNICNHTGPDAADYDMRRAIHLACSEARGSPCNFNVVLKFMHITTNLCVHTRGRWKLSGFCLRRELGWTCRTVGEIPH